MSHSLVIGGTKGLGRVVARKFAGRGDKVSILGRNPSPPSDLESGNVKSFTADISQKEMLLRSLQNVVEAQGKISYCVFLQRYRGQSDDWEGEFHTTLTATRNVVDFLVPHFMDHGDKGIVMVSSIFSKFVGDSQPASYHVMKAGLDQLMRYYAVLLGKKNIRSNGITPFTFLKEESKSFYLQNRPLIDLYQGIIPLQRMGTAEDSADAVEFLCSPRASFLTGQNILVDGGLSLVWPETLARSLKNL